MHMWDHGKICKREERKSMNTLLTWEFKIMASHTYAHQEEYFAYKYKALSTKERTEFLRQTTITQSSNPANNPHNTFKSDS